MGTIVQFTKHLNYLLRAACRYMYPMIQCEGLNIIIVDTEAQRKGGLQ